MSEQAPSPAMSAAGKDPGDPARRKHFVHVYAVVRVKVEVDAENHRATMAAADERLFGNGFAVSLNPRGNGVIEADYAGEVVGYLVDEVDDPVYERTRNYGADHQLQTLDEGRRRLPVTLSEDLRVTLTFVPQIWRDDQAIEDDVSEPTDRTVSRSLLLERFPTEADWYAKAEIRDDLRYEGDAPQWIRDWPGPFEVRLDDDVADVWDGADE
ncbi:MULTISPECIES: hypothetical protein [Hyphomicrobiales]|jgi:hypothetical protein|uniref:Uncharacterized protein n=2 Tax=Hyphomicrobiales TaxID=356 RepID=A6X7X4_BRUA4|nr:MULTISPECIES: hypothetical protein [Hyphomicrobiales]ABS17328.1 hypothetical protein Oant_4739 [Brucella anthropi ATCC 49188]MDH0616167.1 hypothetical protein [Agrobacterium sp. GD03872]MDH0698623.1 hypothetical protein [Agrobacterium sp. GD03871]MDH1061296.1 hypothetical protein [Agrobacterium sp. GD03992]MDH1270732.1 hypothetical protein [Agrobacterium pusense]